MKKLAIAGASVALAAMPVVGVFATSTQFTDTLTVGVQDGCTMQNSQDSATPGSYAHSDRAFIADIAAGTTGWLNASDATTPSTSAGTVSVSCNTDDSSRTYTVTVDVTGLTSGANTIAGGTATSGATSAWAIKSNASGTTASNPFANYATAADGTFLTATANNAVTFNPTYQVYVQPNQAPGNYTGTAVYEINLP